MRVAFIVDKFPNISETFILDEIVGAIRRGIDVHIYALRRGTEADIHPNFRTYQLASRTYYGVPAVENRVLRLFAAVPATWQMLRRNPGALFACLLIRKRGIQTRTFVSMARAFVNSGHHYDVVHAHFGPNGVRADALRKATAFRAPIVTTFHGYDATSFVLHHGSSAYVDLALRGERFIAVSQSIARTISEFGIPVARTRLMPLGVDALAFTASPTHESGNAVRVVSIGRFVEKKGFEYGIAAIMEARRRGANVYYELIGDGELRPELATLVERLGAQEFVLFHGWKNQSEVALLLSCADIMLVPSVTATNGDQESMPIVVKEAMALALPVVATKHAGIPEIVVDGETGMLSAERDAHSLADHLLFLAQRPQVRTRLGRAGRILIEEKYDNERLVDELVTLYRELSGPALDSSPIRTSA